MEDNANGWARDIAIEQMEARFLESVATANQLRTVIDRLQEALVILGFVCVMLLVSFIAVLRC